MSEVVRTSECRSCDASIVWMRTVNDKNIPVDTDTVDEENLEWTTGDHGNQVPVFDPSEHTSHFATCPNADQHRRSR